MELIRFVFHFYALIGILMLIFSNLISNYLYNIVLVYTNKMNLRDFFLFKVNRKNRDTMFSVARYFTIIFGLVIVVTSLYMIHKMGMSIFW